MNPEITLKTITERIFNLIMCFRDNDRNCSVSVKITELGGFQAQSRYLKEN